MAISTDDQAAWDEQLPGAGPAGTRRIPKTADSPGKDFHDETSVKGDESSSH